jgi:hypothetical protein
MKFFRIAVLAFASFAFASPVPDEEHGLQKRTTHTKVNGLKFNIDGTTTYCAGTNSYWVRKFSYS